MIINLFAVQSVLSVFQGAFRSGWIFLFTFLLEIPCKIHTVLTAWHCYTELKCKTRKNVGIPFHYNSTLSVSIYRLAEDWVAPR